MLNETLKKINTYIDSLSVEDRQILLLAIGENQTSIKVAETLEIHPERILYKLRTIKKKTIEISKPLLEALKKDNQLLVCVDTVTHKLLNKLVKNILSKMLKIKLVGNIITYINNIVALQKKINIDISLSGLPLTVDKHHYVAATEDGFILDQNAIVYISTKTIEGNVKAYLINSNAHSVAQIWDSLVKYAPKKLAAEGLSTFDSFIVYLRQRKQNFAGLLMSNGRSSIESQKFIQKEELCETLREDIVSIFYRKLEPKTHEIHLTLIIKEVKEDPTVSGIIKKMDKQYIKDILTQSGKFSPSKHYMISIKGRDIPHVKLTDEVEAILKTNDGPMSIKRIMKELNMIGFNNSYGTVLNALSSNINIKKTANGLFASVYDTKFA